jgi:NAD+ diphosphatase
MKIHRNNAEMMPFCPHCGARDFKPVSMKLFRCEHCGFDFYINVASAAAAIIRDGNGRILAIRRAKEPAIGTLDLPGGFIDYNETAEEGLRRELKEELGLDIEQMQYFCTAYNEYEYKGITYPTLDMVFLCQVNNPDDIVINDEIDEMVWLNASEITIEQFGFTSTRKIMELYKSEYGIGNK